MTLNFFSILVVISVFLTFVLSVFFFITQKGVRTENRTMAALLFIFNLQIIYSFMTSSFAFQYFMDWHKQIFMVRQTSLLIGPLFYFYISSFLKKKDLLNNINLLPFMPFAVSLAFLSIYYRFSKQFIIWESGLDLYDTILILAFNFVYILLSVKSMKSANINLKGFFRSITVASHNTWLQVLLSGFIILWIVNLNSFAIFMIVKKPGWCAYTASIYALTAFLFVNILMFMILVKPDIYYVLTKYKNNKLQESDKQEYLRMLKAYMESHKPFLNPDISLETLANEISVNPRILSQIINETFNKSFKSYILEFRIAESMKILADQKAKKLTILEVLYQVGFNSKSTFNNQFKLYTNLTPQEYRSRYVN